MLWDHWGPISSSPWMVHLEEPYRISPRETQDSKFTGNLRTKSIQFKDKTPPMLAPELLGSHHASVHRLYEGKAQI